MVTEGVCRAIRVGLAIQERIGVCLRVRHVLWERLGLELWLGGDTMPLMVAKEEGLGLQVAPPTASARSRSRRHCQMQNGGRCQCRRASSYVCWFRRERQWWSPL